MNVISWKMIITNSKKKASKDFTMAEWYSRSPDAPPSHEMDDKLIAALQYIRDKYNSPVVITSTYRTRQANADIGGKSNSMHLHGIAVDFYLQDKDHMTDFVDSLRSKGAWYHDLRDMGIAGIGIYNTFVHIDTRTRKHTKAFNTIDSYGECSLWGKW